MLQFLSQLYNNKKAWFKTLPDNIRDFRVMVNGKTYTPKLEENEFPDITENKDIIYTAVFPRAISTYYMIVKDNENNEFKLDTFGNISTTSV